jgi:hypothetical protein
MKDNNVYIVRVGQALRERVLKALEEKFERVHGPTLQASSTVAAFTVIAPNKESVQDAVWGHPELRMIWCEVTEYRF